VVAEALIGELTRQFEAERAPHPGMEKPAPNQGRDVSTLHKFNENPSYILHGFAVDQCQGRARLLPGFRIFLSAA
jgi:hypothetical protein